MGLLRLRVQQQWGSLVDVLVGSGGGGKEERGGLEGG